MKQFVGSNLLIVQNLMVIKNLMLMIFFSGNNLSVNVTISFRYPAFHLKFWRLKHFFHFNFIVVSDVSSVFFNVRPSEFEVLLMSDSMSLGVSIMTYSRPRLRATYKVSLLHTSSIQLQQKFEPWLESSPGPLGHESSVPTTSLGPLWTLFFIINTTVVPRKADVC